MAQIVLAQRLRELGVSEVEVSSAGVSNEEQGNPIDYRAARLLREQGYKGGDISTHRAAQITDTQLRHADLLLAMTASHQRELIRRAQKLGVDPGCVQLYRIYDPHCREQVEAAWQGRSLAGLNVPDPWYGDEDDFRDTLDVVERVSEVLAKNLAQLVEVQEP
jgi:protein-tyrosine-phosphatase